MDNINKFIGTIGAFYVDIESSNSYDGKGHRGKDYTHSDGHDGGYGYGYGQAFGGGWGDYKSRGSSQFNTNNLYGKYR